MSQADESNLPDVIASASGLLTAVPAPISRGAFKALSRLIGVQIDRVLLPVEDRVAGKSQVRQALAAAAAAKAAADPALVERALDSLLDKETRRQRNKDRIAAAALADLTSNEGDAKEGKSAEEAEEVPPPSDDWLNLFERYAEDVSDTELQLLWAKVLSGEVRKPGAWSKKSLRFLAELDQNVAKRFEGFAARRVGDMILRGKEWSAAKLFGEALTLETEGLVNLGAGQLIRRMELGPPIGVVQFGAHQMAVFFAIEGEGTITIEIPAVILTPLGMEIARLLPPHDEVATLKSWAPELGALSPRIVELAAFTGEIPAKIWSRADGTSS